MPFISADVAMATAHGYRMVWIPGAFGNGKTLFAIGMYALYFRPRGYRLVSNIPSLWTEPDLDAIELDENGKLKAFVLIDEGGQYFQSGRTIKELTRNPRKMDYLLVFPSFHPPHRMAQIYQIQPVWSWRSAGIPLINYRWSVSIGHFRNSGAFQWFGFQEVFGTYSSVDPAVSPAKIRKWLDKRNAQYRNRFGYDEEDEVLDQSQSDEEGSVIRAVDELGGELASLTAQTDAIQTLVARGSKRR